MYMAAHSALSQWGIRSQFVCELNPKFSYLGLSEAGQVPWQAVVRAALGLRAGRLSCALRCVVPAAAGTKGPAWERQRGGLQVRQLGLCVLWAGPQPDPEVQRGRVRLAPVGDGSGSFPVRTLPCSTRGAPLCVTILWQGVEPAEGCGQWSLSGSALPGHPRNVCVLCQAWHPDCEPSCLGLRQALCSLRARRTPAAQPGCLSLSLQQSACPLLPCKVDSECRQRPAPAGVCPLPFSLEAVAKPPPGRVSPIPAPPHGAALSVACQSGCRTQDSCTV